MQRALSERSAERMGMGARLMAFFGGGRPTQAELEARGIVRPKSFAVSLENLYAKASLLAPVESALHGALQVPAVLATLLSHMERARISELQGVFRLSGDSVEIANTRERLDSGAVVDLAKVGPHSVSGLVKLFLRLLPEPLMLFDNYDGMVAAFRAEQFGKLDMILSNGMPRSHRHTWWFLLDFLSRVWQHSATNLMQSTNIAIWSE
jgi:hypothetical protein